MHHEGLMNGPVGRVLVLNLELLHVLHFPRNTKGLIYTASDHRGVLMLL